MARMICIFFLTLAGAAKAGPSASAAGPRAVCERPIADIGVVEQGRIAEVNFTIRNRGDKTLVIGGITSSCGCTAASATGNTVPPGGAVQIRARYDTKGRLGHSEKTIQVAVNDPQLKLITLTLRGAVINPEQGVPLDRAIFSQTCASCHKTPGIGRTGENLYRAVCAMCHDGRLPGLAAPRSALSKKSRSALVEKISRGRPGSSMPGFGRENGGFLTPEQIRSLADYIRKK